MRVSSNRKHLLKGASVIVFLVLVVLAVRMAVGRVPSAVPTDANTVAKDSLPLTATPFDAPVNKEVINRIPLNDSTHKEADEIREDLVGSLAVDVLYDDRSVAVGVGLVASRPLGERAVGLRRAKTDANGHAELYDLPAGRIYIQVDRMPATAELSHVDIVPGEQQDITIIVPVALEIIGHVVDWEGRSVPQAEIWLVPLANPRTDAQLVTHSDMSGRFVLRSGHIPSIIGARAHGFAPSVLTFVDKNTDDRHEPFVLTLPETGGNVAGVVRDEAGRPVADAVVRIGSGRIDNVLPVAEISPALPCQTTTDADGRFLAIGIPVGPQAVTARAPGTAPWSGSCDILGRETATLEIVLCKGATVIGRVTAAGGQPASGALVQFGQEGLLTCSYAWTDQEGEYRIDGVAPGEQRAVAEHRIIGRAAQTVRLSPGKRHTLDFILTRGLAIRGSLVTHQQDPVAGARIELWDGPDNAGRRIGVTKTEPNGSWQLAALQSKSLRILARHASIETVSRNSVDPTQGPVHLIARAKWERKDKATVIGRLVDAESQPVPAAVIELKGSDSGTTSTDPEGMFQIDAYPGEYTITYTAKGLALLVGSSFTLGPGAREDLGNVTISPGGEIELLGEPSLRRGTMGLAYNEATWVGTIWKETGFKSGLLAPGEYDVVVRGPGMATIVEKVRVSARAVSRVHIAPVRGYEQQFQIQIAPEFANDAVTVKIAPVGALPISLVFPDSREMKEMISFSETLGLGSHTIEVATPGRSRASAFSVSEAARGIVRLRLP